MFQGDNRWTRRGQQEEKKRIRKGKHKEQKQDHQAERRRRRGQQHNRRAWGSPSRRQRQEEGKTSKRFKLDDEWPESIFRFTHSTRTISAEGCARTAPIVHFARSTRTISAIALSPAFRALDTHDLRRGLRADRANRTRACISRPRHARSPQRVARGPRQSHSCLHFARSTRTISAEGCAEISQIALSPAFRALDTHDLRRGLRGNFTNRALACISRTRHARAPQRVARAWDKSHSRLRFAHSTRTISAEGCARTGQIALSPAFRALDTHDLRRGLHFRLTLFVPSSAFKREFVKWGNVFH